MQLHLHHQYAQYTSGICLPLYLHSDSREDVSFIELSKYFSLGIYLHNVTSTCICLPWELLFKRNLGKSYFEKKTSNLDCLISCNENLI